MTSLSERNELRAGVARTDITPRIGVHLSGYGPHRPNTGAHDPLECRALVIEADGALLAIVSCDLVGLSQWMTDAVREDVQAIGIPSERVLISCTHTHAGPNTIGCFGIGEPNEEYLSALPTKVSETIRAAATDLRPVGIAIGRTLVEGIGRNRVHPDGTGLIDPEVTVVRVTDDSGRRMALLYHFGAHPVVMGPQNDLCSGDWPASTVRYFEEDGDGPAFVSFLNGTAGDINSIDAVLPVPEGWDAADRIGSRMHAAIAELLPTMVDEPRLSVAGHLERVRLPIGTPDEMVAASVLGNDEGLMRVWRESIRSWMARPDPDHLEIELQALRLGPLAILAAPAEIFTLHGFAIKQRSPFRWTVVVSCSNGFFGYIPRPQDYDDSAYGGHAAFRAPVVHGRPPLARNADSIFLASAAKALNAALNVQ